jgi:CRISPR-associated protein Cmr6
MVYSQNSLELDPFGTGGQRQPVFRTSGLLQWQLQKTIPPERAEQLKELIAVLCGLTMALAGFGRTWRRPDHRLFKPTYKTTPIGCHWQWLNQDELPKGLHVQSGKDLEALLQRSRRVAKRWLGAEGGKLASWREVMAPGRMRVWVKVADGAAEATVVHWLHEPSLKRSDLTGRVRNSRIDALPTRVGSIWNRLLPIVGGQAALRGATASATARPARRPTPGQQGPQGESQAVYAPHGGPFLESVVVFPPRRPNGELTPESKAFVERLGQAGFTELDWSDPSV